MAELETKYDGGMVGLEYTALVKNRIRVLNSCLGAHGTTNRL